MTDISARRQAPALGTFVRVPGQVVACAAVPLSLTYGPVLPVPNILASFYVIAAIGLLAVFRGAVVPRRIVQAGYVCIAWYSILLAIDLWHGGPFHLVLQYQIDFLLNGYVLLALPFFAIGLRETRFDMRMFERVAMVCLALIAIYSLYQLLVLDIDRPRGLSTNPNPFGLICLAWSLCLFVAAFRRPAIDWLRLGTALVGLIPVIASGSKNAWICAALAGGVILLLWARDGRRWRTIAVAALAMIPLAWILYTSGAIRNRVNDVTREINHIVEEGDTSGISLGLRLAADLGGIRAIAERPLLGYGMQKAKLAATEHSMPGMSPFAALFYVHNDYITYTLGFGIPGLLFVLSLVGGFFVAAAWNGDRTMRRYGIAMGITFAAYLAAEDISYHPQLQGLAFFVLGLVLMPTDSDEPAPVPAAGPRAPVTA